MTRLVGVSKTRSSARLWLGSLNLSGQCCCGPEWGDADNIRWTFGGNRLQTKAECQIIVDLEAALKSVAPIGSRAAKTLHTLTPKQDLLLSLLEDELSRLQVWLHPCENDSRHRLSLRRSDKPMLDVRVPPSQIDRNMEADSYYSYGIPFFSTPHGLRTPALQFS
jgi:hypothetical protein